ncbi:hypothetical protein ABW20_dc0105523 [Dactylellina cionopaga]|nr:hypothetical protein ABW20_dc0105523 [Dactylellina cionopaga]
MTKLRLEASKALKRQLGLSIEPQSVEFNGKDFPKKNAAYIWNTRGNILIEEYHVLDRTIDCGFANQRYRNWDERHKEILTDLIKRDCLIPEYHDKSSQTSQNSQTMLGLESIDSEARGKIGSQSVKRKRKEETDQSIPHEDKRPAKRRREASVELGSNDSTSIDFGNTTLVAGSNELTSPDITLPKPPMILTGSFSEEETRAVKRRRPQPLIIPEASSATIFTMDGNDPTILQSPIESPRTMAPNSSGILELNPAGISIPPVYTTSPGFAPVAPSLATTGIDIISPVTIRNGDLDSDEESADKSGRIKPVKDMRECMQGFLDHASVVYLESIRLKKEMREERENHLAKEKQYEEKMQLLYTTETTLRDQVASLHTITNENSTLKLEAMELQRQEKVLMTERNGLQEKLEVLEKDIALSRQYLNQSKGAYQKLTTQWDDLHSLWLTQATNLKDSEATTKALQEERSTLQDTIRRHEETISKQVSDEKALQEKLRVSKEENKVIATERDSLLNKIKDFFSVHANSFVRSFASLTPSMSSS